MGNVVSPGKDVWLGAKRKTIGKTMSGERFVIHDNWFRGEGKEERRMAESWVGTTTFSVCPWRGKAERGSTGVGVQEQYEHLKGDQDKVLKKERTAEVTVEKERSAEVTVDKKSIAAPMEWRCEPKE